MNAVRFIARWWAAFALLAAVAMLGFAHASELPQFGGYAPCHLCLKQRDIYWFAIAVAAPATFWAVLSRSKRTPRVASVLLFGIFLTGAIIATYHAGVELKWWKGPESCTGSGASVDSTAIAAILGGVPTHPPMCDVAVWFFGGLSMAAWNAIFSTLLALISAAAAMRRKETQRAK